MKSAGQDRRRNRCQRVRLSGRKLWIRREEGLPPRYSKCQQPSEQAVSCSLVGAGARPAPTLSDGGVAEVPTVREGAAFHPPPP